MQCKQCGKWFAEKSIGEIYCSIECWNRAQLERVKQHYSFTLYINGEEVKTVDDFDLHFAEIPPKRRGFVEND